MPLLEAAGQEAEPSRSRRITASASAISTASSLTSLSTARTAFSTAVGLSVYAALAVPGLLQTTEYAKAVFRMQRPLLDDDVTEQRLAARMARQEIFTRRPALF